MQGQNYSFSGQFSGQFEGLEQQAISAEVLELQAALQAALNDAAEIQSAHASLARSKASAEHRARQCDVLSACVRDWFPDVETSGDPPADALVRSSVMCIPSHCQCTHIINTAFEHVSKASAEHRARQCDVLSACVRDWFPDVKTSGDPPADALVRSSLLYRQTKPKIVLNFFISFTQILFDTPKNRELEAM